MTFRSVKIKNRNDYNLSGIGVGVLPALAIPRISGGSSGGSKYGPPNGDVGGDVSISVATADKKSIVHATQLQHHILPSQRHLQDKPIKHTQKKKNFMSIFEKKK